MNERRRIIIETGANPDESLPTPHFDVEATQTARRVVPLADQATSQGNYSHPAGRTAKQFWKHPTLVVVVALVAIGLGVAAGFAIGIYRNRNTAETSTAPSPTPAVDNADVGQTVEPPLSSPRQASAPVPGDVEQPSIEPVANETGPTARNDRKNNDKDVERPVVVPDQEPETSDNDKINEEREANRIEREQRREERRERRRRQREEDLNVPRQIERDGDRIREIFEGRQP